MKFKDLLQDKNKKFTFKDENGDIISIRNPTVIDRQAMCRVNGMEWRFIPLEEIEKIMRAEDEIEKTRKK